MKRIVLSILVGALFVGIAAPAARANILDNDIDVLNACSDGSCSVPGAAGGFTGATGPTNTVSGGLGDRVVVTNPFIGVASPALNSISLSSAAQTGQTFFEWAQTFVLEALKKRILDMMVDQIVNWVQGGDDPKFVTDWKQFLADAANVAIGNLAVRVAGAGICEPFRAGILEMFTVPDPQRFSDGDLYGSSITCTLDEIVDNIEDFYADFNNGGWAAYNRSLQVHNDPLALFITARSTVYLTAAEARKTAELEATSGGGFLSTRTCNEDPLSSGPDLDKDGIPGDIASTCRITTPGSVIGDIVGKAVGADIDYIVNAQQLASYVAAISDALFNRLIREGVGGLQGLSTSRAPSGGFIPATPAGTNECQSLGSPELISACNGYVSSNNGNFDITRRSLLAGIDGVKAELTVLRTELALWKATADDLSTFVAAESAGGDAACISAALNPYFSDPTPAGVAAVAESITAQMLVIDLRITTLDAYRAQLEAAATSDWAEFIVLASEVQSQLSLLRPAPDAAETAAAQREAMQTAFDLDIRPEISLRCS